MKNAIRMLVVVLCGGVLAVGCSVTKVEYEKNDKGDVSYRLYRNDHWLKTESTGLRGGMTDAGKFEFAAEGMKASPSEEFNRTMQTYTTAFVQLAQIAAAAYNPSSSQAVSTATKSTSAAPTVVVNTQQAETNATGAASTTSATNSAECVDCKPPASEAK